MSNNKTSNVIDEHKLKNQNETKTDIVNVKDISITPNECPITEHLCINIDYSTSHLLKNAHWKLEYVVDYTYQRHIIEIGRSEVEPNIDRGEHQFQYKVEEINVDAVPESALLNVGVLTVTLYADLPDAPVTHRDQEQEQEQEQEHRELLRISMVTMVSRHNPQQDRPILYRNILNPLAE